HYPPDGERRNRRPHHRAGSRGRRLSGQTLRPARAAGSHRGRSAPQERCLRPHQRQTGFLRSLRLRPRDPPAASRRGDHQTDRRRGQPARGADLQPRQAHVTRAPAGPGPRRRGRGKKRPGHRHRRPAAAPCPRRRPQAAPLDPDRLGRGLPVFALSVRPMSAWRSLLPRSLSTRMVLLTLGTIILVQAATFATVNYYRKQFTEEVSVELTATTIRTLRAALAEIPAEQRPDFVRNASQNQWRLWSRSLPSNASLE